MNVTGASYCVWVGSQYREWHGVIRNASWRTWLFRLRTFSTQQETVEDKSRVNRSVCNSLHCLSEVWLESSARWQLKRQVWEAWGRHRMSEMIVSGVWRDLLEMSLFPVSLWCYVEFKVLNCPPHLYYNDLLNISLIYWFKTNSSSYSRYIC